MSDPLSYIQEIIAKADSLVPEGQEQVKVGSSLDNANIKLADFLDKVAENLDKKEETFDNESKELFTGESTKDDVLKLRVRVKQRIQQLGTMGIPG